MRRPIVTKLTAEQFEVDRQALIKELHGASNIVYTVAMGQNRRSGGCQSVMCLIRQKNGIKNISGAVSDLLSIGWYDNGSVSHNTPHALIRMLSKKVYGSETVIEQRAL